MGRAADHRAGPDAPVPDASLYVAERLLAVVRDDLARADTKAAVLLSGALAAPALLFGGQWPCGGALRAWPPLLWPAAGFWAAGTALLVWAILPRTRTLRPGPGITYFGDARPGRDPADLLRDVAAAGLDRVGWLMTQFVDISGILTVKFRCMRWGMCCLALGLTLAAAGLGLG